MSLLQRAFIVTIVLLLLVVAGLSFALYRVQERHGNIITAESIAVQRLELTDRAALRLAEQREAVAASTFLPFDRTGFAQESTVFQQLMSAQFLAYTPEGYHLQQAILLQQQQFSQDALRLPAHPTPAQVLPVYNIGDALATMMQAFRTRHTVDLAALRTSEAQQRRWSLLMIMVANGILFFLALAGIILLERLGRQQSEAATLRDG